MGRQSCYNGREIRRGAKDEEKRCSIYAFAEFGSLGFGSRARSRFAAGFWNRRGGLRQRRVAVLWLKFDMSPPRQGATEIHGLGLSVDPRRSDGVFRGCGH